MAGEANGVTTGTRRRRIGTGEASATATTRATEIIPTGAPDTADAVAAAEVAPSSSAAGTWGGLIETVLEIGDPRSLYDRLYAELSLEGGELASFGAIAAAANHAERNIVDATRLHRAARLEEERVRYDTAKREEILRTSARAELEREKADGKRSKAPTIQDVEDRMIASWPDALSDIRGARDKVHAVVETTDALCRAWVSRAATLRSMLDRFAPRRDPIT